MGHEVGQAGLKMKQNTPTVWACIIFNTIKVLVYLPFLRITVGFVTKMTNIFVTCSKCELILS
jgi:hypothetical protein